MGEEHLEMQEGLDQGDILRHVTDYTSPGIHFTSLGCFVEVLD